MNLRGASAVVTGGGSGLGAATSARLTAAGAFVTVFDIDAARGEAVMRSLGGKARHVCGDVSSEADLRRAISVAEEGGAVRVMVNCAGIGLPRRLLGRTGDAHSSAEFERVIRVNLLGTFNGMRLGAEAIARAEPEEDGERGVIVNTGSVAAFEGQVGQVSYAASKGAIVAMTLPAARDLADRGIRVCAVAPGLMDTPLFQSLPDVTIAGLARDVPFPRRFGSAEEFAELVAHIVVNRYLNGEVIRIDGGLRMAAR